MKKIVLLGATGSIGENTLQVIRTHPDELQLIGIAANSNETKLESIAQEFDCKETCLFRRDGIDRLVELATLEDADVIVVATTGTITLKPTLEALKAGKRVALASKEVLVMAGQFVSQVLKESSGEMLPVDSEHSALFQCLEAVDHPSHLRRIILTASGGPFRDYAKEQLKHVTLADALKHPNWEMGPKITIDSATMANKGLEMIEARWLFNIAPNQIDAIIHPQSIIHSLIEFIDGSVIAQLSPPSMTFAIQHSLLYPERTTPPAKSLDFTKACSLELRPIDPKQFPCLELAKATMKESLSAPTVFNSANGIAVEAFLKEKIHFIQIPQLIEKALSSLSFPDPNSLEDILEVESIAKLKTAEILASGSF